MKILVVDDHKLLHDALQHTLEELAPSVTIYSSYDGQTALECARELEDLDLVLLDLRLPDMDGSHVLTELRIQHPETAVVILSGVGNNDSMHHALKLGAQGYIPKTVNSQILLAALRLVMAGGIYIHEDFALKNPNSATSASASADGIKLSAQQIKIFKLLLQGKSNKQIGKELGLAEATVKRHVTAILKALNVTSRAQAIVAGNRLGWDPE